MKTLYASDLDGTLLNKEKALSTFTLNTLNSLIKKGICCTVATARSVYSCYKIIDGLNLKIPAVTMNGVCLTDIESHHSVDISYFTPETAKAVINAFRSAGKEPFVFFATPDSLDVEFISCETDYERGFFEERRFLYSSLKTVDNFKLNENVMYVNSLVKEDRAFAIEKNLKSIPDIAYALYRDVYKNGFYFLEVYSKSAGKLNGLRRLQKQLGCDRLVVFGDNYNDIEMLKGADVGIAVGNAVDEAKQAADLVIGTNDEDSVAKYILSEYKKRCF